MKPGIHKLSNALYHGGEGISSSGIKELIKSPKHFLAYLQGERKQTPEMIRGTIVHALILEPETFDNEFVVGEFSIRRGKEYDRLVAENPDKTVISLEELQEGKRIAEAFHVELSQNPELKALWDGQRELSMYWEDKNTGILCKCRPDLLSTKGHIIDVKTTYDASYDSFQKQMVDLKYFVSAAFYLRGVKEALSHTNSTNIEIPTKFTLVCIETKAPYCIAVYTLSDKTIEIGMRLVDQALELYAEAVVTNDWHGYSRKIREIELPNWALYKLNYLGKKE